MSFFPASRAFVREPPRIYIAPPRPQRAHPSHQRSQAINPPSRSYSTQTTPPAPPRQFEIITPSMPHHSELEAHDRHHVKPPEHERTPTHHDTAETIAQFLKQQEYFVNLNAKMSV